MRKNAACTLLSVTFISVLTLPEMESSSFHITSVFIFFQQSLVSFQRLFGLVRIICFTFGCSKCTQKRLMRFKSGDWGVNPSSQNSPFVLSFLNSFLHRWDLVFLVVILWFGSSYHSVVSCVDVTTSTSHNAKWYGVPFGWNYVPALSVLLILYRPPTLL